MRTGLSTRTPSTGSCPGRMPMSPSVVRAMTISASPLQIFRSGATSSTFIVATQEFYGTTRPITTSGPGRDSVIFAPRERRDRGMRLVVLLDRTTRPRADGIRFAPGTLEQRPGVAFGGGHDRERGGRGGRTDTVRVVGRTIPHLEAGSVH